MLRATLLARICLHSTSLLLVKIPFLDLGSAKASQAGNLKLFLEAPVRIFLKEVSQHIYLRGLDAKAFAGLPTG